LWIFSQIETGHFYCKLTKKSMFPVLYDGAGSGVYKRPGDGVRQPGLVTGGVKFLVS
jgi:hypothetical protein